MTFTHPLARDAKIWRTAGLKGKARNLLVIITTLELDKAHKRYKAEKVDRLSAAAKQWIEDNPTDAVDYLLMSRPKAWAGDKAASD